MCPILSRVYIDDSFLDSDFGILFFFMTGSICFNLLFPSLFQVSCHNVSNVFVITCFRSDAITLRLCETLGSFSAVFAALSASSFPRMPMWLGTQQKTICFPLWKAFVCNSITLTTDGFLGL